VDHGAETNMALFESILKNAQRTAKNRQLVTVRDLLKLTVAEFVEACSDDLRPTQPEVTDFLDFVAPFVKSNVGKLNALGRVGRLLRECQVSQFPRGCFKTAVTSYG